MRTCAIAYWLSHAKRVLLTVNTVLNEIKAQFLGPHKRAIWQKHPALTGKLCAHRLHDRVHPVPNTKFLVDTFNNDDVALHDVLEVDLVISMLVRARACQTCCYSLHQVRSHVSQLRTLWQIKQSAQLCSRAQLAHIHCTANDSSAIAHERMISQISAVLQRHKGWPLKEGKWRGQVGRQNNVAVGQEDFERAQAAGCLLLQSCSYRYRLLHKHVTS